MEQPQYLINSNAVIDYLGSKLPASGMDFMNVVIDAIPNVSGVTKIEVLGFNTSDQHFQLLTNFINDSVVLDLSNNVVDTSIDIRKKHKTKLPDAIIAATALTHKLTLITANDKDFLNIQGLHVVNPHKL